MARNIPLFLVAECLRGVFFSYAVATLFYIEIGISFTQLSVLWLAMALVQLVLEVPLGIVSDRIGHRWTILLGYGAFAMAIGLIGSGTDMWLPLAGGAMWGVSGALLSGATDAFLYDSLVALGRADDYLRMKGRVGVAGSIGIIVGAVPGAYLYTVDIRYPWYAQAACIVLAAVVFAFTVAPPVARADDAPELSHWGHFRSAVGYLREHKPLLWLTLVLTLGTFPLYGMSMIRQPYLVERGVAVPHLGYIFAGVEVLGSVVGMQAHRIEARLGLSGSIGLTVGGLLALFALCAWAGGYLAILPLAMLYAAFRLQGIVLNAHSNQRIPSDRRATILSVQSMGGSVLLVGFMLASGWILDTFPIDRYLLMTVGYLALTLLPLWLLRRRFGVAG